MVGLLDLPSDIFEEIFKYVRVTEILRLEQTCVQLQRLSGLFWAGITDLKLIPFLQQQGRVNISNAYKFDLSSSGLIRRTGAHLRSLDISKFGPLEYGLRAGLESAVLHYCTWLSHLCIDNRLLERHWLLKLSAATGHSLKSLSLAHAYIRDYGELDDDLLYQLLLNWCNLEELSLRENPRIRLGCHSVLPLSLKSLDIQSCTQVRTRALLQVCNRCVHLESLSVSYSYELAALPSELLLSLKRLSVDGCSSLLTLERQFTGAIGSLSNLVSLTVSSHFLSDWLFALMAENLGQLELLCLPGSRPPAQLTSVPGAVRQLARLTNLTRVRARGNERFGRTLLTSVGRLRVLHELDVSYAVRRRDMTGAWAHVASASLALLVARGLVAPLDARNAAADDLRLRLLPNCPKLVAVLL